MQSWRCRCIFLVGTSFLLAIITCLTGLADVSLLWVTSPLCGFVYGANWSLVPALTSEFFGLSHFGINYCFLTTGVGIGSFLVSNVMVRLLRIPHRMSFKIAKATIYWGNLIVCEDQGHRHFTLERDSMAIAISDWRLLCTVDLVTSHTLIWRCKLAPQVFFKFDPNLPYFSWEVYFEWHNSWRKPSKFYSKFLTTKSDADFFAVIFAPRKLEAV